MGRLTRWGCDQRGVPVVPVPLVRPILRLEQRRKQLRRAIAACAIPGPAEELDPAWSWADLGVPIEAALPVADPDLDRPDPDENEDFAADMETAVSARALPKGTGCEGRAPEGTSGAAASEVNHPANARPTRVPSCGAIASGYLSAGDGDRGRSACLSAAIDLRNVPSAMERAAEAFSAPSAAAPVSARTPGPDESGKVWCKCGGADGGKVPGWFGRDCIERDCPLRSAAKAAA